METTQWFVAACFGVAVVARLAYIILTWHTNRRGRAERLFLDEEEAERLKAGAPLLILVGALLFVLGGALMMWAGPKVEHGGGPPSLADEAMPQQMLEALLLFSFLPIAGGGALLVVGVRRLNPDLSVRR